MKKLGLIIISLLTLFSLSACSIIIEQISNLASSESSSTQEGSSDNEGKLQASSKKKKEVYKVGDKITFDNIAEYTITKAEWSEEGDKYESNRPEKVLKVTYNVTNLSTEELFLGTGMELYVGNKKMQTYSIGSTYDTISEGRSYDHAVANFAVNGDGNIELEIQPSYDSQVAVVSIEINDGKA